MSNQVYSNSTHQYDVNTDNLYLSGSTNSLNSYTVTSINGSMAGPFSSPIGAIIKISKLNNIVTLSESALVSGTQGSSTLITYSTPIPVNYRPINPAIMSFAIYVVDGGARFNGSLLINPSTGVITIFKNVSDNFSGSGIAGIYPFTISYDLSN